MAYLLCLETASKNCSISIFENDKCISLVEESSDNYIHAEKLNYFVKWALETINIDFKDLSGVVISEGPGSYTGLRIGLASAKAFCFSLDIPLISVDTLQSLARTAKDKSPIIIPAIDARRNEIYCSVMDKDFKIIEPTQALVLNLDFFEPFRNEEILILGDGAKKTKDFLPNFHIKIQENLPTAETLGILGFEKFKNNEFEDVAYFEPFYLKNFVNNIKK